MPKSTSSDCCVGFGTTIILIMQRRHIAPRAIGKMSPTNSEMLWLPDWKMVKNIFERKYQIMFWQIFLSILYLRDFEDTFLDFSPVSKADILQIPFKWLYVHNIFC